MAEAALGDKRVGVMSSMYRLRSKGRTLITHRPHRGLRPVRRRNAFPGLRHLLLRRNDMHVYIHVVLQHTVCLVEASALSKNELEISQGPICRLH